MTVTIEIRPLRPSDRRDDFSCGEPAIDRYFRQHAGVNQFKLRLGVSYVAVRDEHIIGFATVVVGSLERASVPDAKMRRRLPSYPLPILRLARLGVDQSAQGLGVGHKLLKHVFNVALLQRDTAGCVGVVTDAKPKAVAFYERLGFLPLEGVLEVRIHDETTPMFLDIHAIAVAAAK